MYRFVDYEKENQNINENVKLGKMSVLDDLDVGIRNILDNYYDDFSESNYWGYDVCNVSERDMLLSLLEKIDNNSAFSKKEKFELITFLDELKKDFVEDVTIRTIDSLIDLVNSQVPKV